MLAPQQAGPAASWPARVQQQLRRWSPALSMLHRVSGAARGRLPAEPARLPARGLDMQSSGTQTPLRVLTPMGSLLEMLARPVAVPTGQRGGFATLRRGQQTGLATQPRGQVRGCERPLPAACSNSRASPGGIPPTTRPGCSTRRTSEPQQTWQGMLQTPGAAALQRSGCTRHGLACRQAFRPHSTAACRAVSRALGKCLQLQQGLQSWLNVLLWPL